MVDERRPPNVLPRERLLLAVILCVSGLLRAGYVSEFSAAPDFEHPFIDAGFHDNWARSIAFEDWTRPAHLPDPELETTPYLRPPGYPVFLSLIYRAFGPGYLAPRIVQAGLGLLAVFLIYRIGRRLADPPVGLVAAALYGCAWVPIYFEAEFHAASLLVVLLLALWDLLATWSLRPAPGRAFAAGLLLGAAALVRPNALALVPVVLVWGAWVLARCGSRARGATALGFVCATLLAIAPATLRNWRASGEFVPITTGLGVNLFIGNHAGATGRIEGQLPGIGRFDTCYDYPAVVASIERQLQRNMTHKEVSSWFVDQALRFVTSQPKAALQLTAHKLKLALSAEEISHNKVLALERRHSAVLSRLPGPFPVYLAGAFVGFAAWCFGRRRGLASADTRVADSRAQGSRTETGVLLFVSAAVLLVSLLPFFAAARYRVPLWPVAALFAAFGAVSVFRWFRRGQWGPAFLALAAFSVPAWLSMGAASGAQDLAKWHCDRGRSLRRAGEFEAADREYRLALAVPPPRAEVYYEYGLLCMDRGLQPQAIEAYERAIELDPAHLLANYNLGTIHARQGEREPATDYLERALQIEPGYAPAALNLASLHFNLGDPKAALAACSRLLALEPAQPDALSLAARCHERMGDPGRAVELYEALLLQDSASSSWRQKLAWILATSPVAKVRDGQRALELVEGLAGPDAGPDLLGTLAAALAETGEFARATQVAERALELAEERGQGRRVGVLRSVLESCRAGRPVRPGP